MRNRNFPVRILGWLTGVSLCLAAAAVWAQTPDLGLPTAGGENNPGFLSGPDEGVLGQGSRIPKLDAGFTAPGPDQLAQLFIVATLPSGANTYSTTQRPGGPVTTQMKVVLSSDVPIVGDFQSVEPPQIKHFEDAYPGLPLEEHSGTVKWVAPIRLAAGIKPERVKIEGKVYMQLCDHNGCVPPKDYPFSATFRPDVQAVTVAGPQRPKVTPVAAPPSVSPPPRIARNQSVRADPWQCAADSSRGE